MKIEVLYLHGCPNYEPLVSVIRDALARADAAEIERRPVETEEDAARERFLGSPSVRVDGADVDPSAAERNDYGLKCRLYRSADGATSGLPPEEWVMAAIGRSGTRQ